MAKRFSLQTALELILEEKEDCDDAAEEDVSENEDHISEHSESDSEFEEEKTEDHPAESRATIQQPGEGNQSAKHKRTSDIEPPCQQPGPAPACQQQACEQQAIGCETVWLSKDGKIQWCSTSRPEPPRIAANVIQMAPGPTRLAVTYVSDIRSSFDMFMPPPIKNIILDCTNIEGRRVFGERWKDLDETDLDAYFGVLILAGVFKSKGEATESLWDKETGRELFQSTMSLQTFNIISRTIRFDVRDDRPVRQQRDKLAAIRTVWDKWVARLPLLYNPGPNVTVDEQLMPFRGRCPFRQYIPSKPAKYGIKIWAACDSASSYAWNLQVYTGKCRGGAPEKNQGMRVVLDMAQGLSGHNITCDNFFTSHKLGQELLKRKVTMLGTVRKNKLELPPHLLKLNNRPVYSSKFAYTPDTTLVSYVPKKGKNVVLMSTLHRSGRICGQDHLKPEMVMDYNATKGGVDNLDKLVTTYSCKRRTLRWPLVLFFDMLDISAYNAFVIWMSLHPHWNEGMLQKRRLYLEELGKMLVRPQIGRRQHLPRTPVSAAIVRRIQEEDSGATSCEITETSSAMPEVTVHSTDSV
ncbi:piggyBac transposable element-derived protein 4-like [Neoarius graeffei]|uniref:piggyBac transposable element-derived protein 4-like n=1 Tax=Neoarius graeffei TaxID=443677 RepID=UPI00298C2DD6|nr:piggyBac transposable element-derived protein 4-like [Neoarius graeffei]